MTHKQETAYYAVLEKHGITGEAAVEIVSDLITIETTSLKQVIEFHETFNHPVVSQPTVPDWKRLKLRLDLIGEEFVELAQAFHAESLLITTIADMLEKIAMEDKDNTGLVVNMLNGLNSKLFNRDWSIVPYVHAKPNRGRLVTALDALCDIRYVVDGTIIELGLQHVFDEAFETVHTSNMSKACNDLEEAKATIAAYTLRGVSCEMIENDNGVWIVRNVNNGKILKSVGYTAVNLEPFID